MKLTAVAPAKINLQLNVGGLRADGYHDLVTVYQALDLFDQVSISERSEGMGISCEVSGEFGFGVPHDETNLAVQAVIKIAELCNKTADVAISIEKRIPVAAGLAGGSADAAAALVAAAELFNFHGDLQLVAGELGSDIGFALMGGTALGTSRGESVVPVLARGEHFWVIMSHTSGLSTPRVYQKLDQLRDEGSVATPMELSANNKLLQALVSGSSNAVSDYLHNDLQTAALAISPKLQQTLDTAIDDGALAALISGSGPTCLALAKDYDHALDIAARVSSANVCDRVFVAKSPADGAKVISREHN
jgi:4-diphosphocytidyl-2-C-methyl-D-erythritol kinase